MFGKILEHKITLTIAVLLCAGVVGVGGYYLFRPISRPLSAVQAKVMTIQEEVTASGSVDSDRHVSLAFPKSGTVIAVNVAVGDHVTTGQVLAYQEAGQLQASLLAAQADVQSAQANLSLLQKGATNETRTVYSQNVASAQLSLATANRDAYLKIQDALVNKISAVFSDTSGANPTLRIPTSSFSIATELNAGRSSLTGQLSNWNADLATDPSGDAALSAATSTMAYAFSFINALSAEVTRLSTTNSSMPQSSLDATVSAVTGAASEINTAQTSFTAALDSYKNSTDQLSVVVASSTPEAVQIALAALSKAQANVASIQSQLNDTRLIAPWEGIVSSVNPKAGESFPAETTAIDIISTGAFKIDVMIPENEIGAIAPGNEADIQFDAYGAAIAATGTISSIDLSPTVTNGVSAYKATISINGSDPRVRTGMTANVAINGLTAADAVAVPSSAIVTKSDGAYVLVIDPSGSTYTERKIVTGVSGSGWTQVVSGLAVGEPVAAFGQ